MSSYKIRYGTVVSPLCLLREKTRRELPIFPVIAYALTADAFSSAWLIGTGAIGLILFYITCAHIFPSLFIRFSHFYLLRIYPRHSSPRVLPLKDALHAQWHGQQ